LIYSGANLSAGVSIPWMVLRAGNNGSFGLSIAGGRDVNGDGSPDIVIGAPDHGMGPSGRVYVYFGGASLDTIPDVVLEGEPSFGDCVALQDVTGDGVAEVIVGADAYPWRGLGDRGHAYVYDLARPLAARSFVHGAQRSVPIGESREPLWIQMEPVGGTYANEAVDWSSLQLHLPESATAIHPLSGKGVIEEDSDHNGILELRIGFSATDLARLVTEPGRHVVTLDVDGRTLSGRALQSSLEVTLVRTGGKAPLRASVQPNPLNPSGEIVFATAREGRSTLRVYDVTGRLLREISQTSAAGTQRIAFDGRDQQGRSLASGIYLYRIHAPDGDQRGRFTIAK
jgi:hypothetical protein